MDGYNAGYAQILDQSGIERAAQYAGQMRERRRLLDQQRADRELRRKDLLTRYAGEQFTDKDYATGTQYDPIIRQRLSDIRTKYADMIRTNRGIELPELAMLMQKDIADMGNLSGKIKLVRQNIESTADKYKGVRGIDANAIRMTALNDALFKPDGKGGKMLKGIDEINENIDYGAYALDNHYDKIFNLGDDDVIAEVTKGLAKESFGDVYDVTGSKGDRVKKKYAAETFPVFQDIYKDPKTGEVSIRTKADNINLGNGDIPVAPENVYNGFMADPVKRMFLNRKLDEVMPGMDKTSAEADLMRRKILFDVLDNSLPKSIKRDIVEKAAPAPKISVSVNTGSEEPFRDLWEESISVLGDKEENLSVLPIDAQNKIMDFVQKQFPADWGGKKSQDDVSVKKEGDVMGIYLDGKKRATVKKQDLNLAASSNQGVKKQRSIIQRIFNPKPKEETLAEKMRRLSNQK